VVALAPYTIWVIGYDVPWVYRLWRLNRLATPHQGRHQR
jgi:hypothetical protein